MSQPEPIVQYWDAAEIPADVAALTASFADFNPGMPHLLFDRRRAAALIGDRFGGRMADAFESCAVPAMQADYFRYCAVLALGGVYADVDFRCLAPLRPLLGEGEDGVLFGRPVLPERWRRPELESRPRVGPYRVVMNSFFAFERPGHPLLELAVEIATANVERRVAEDVALVTGPAVLTSLYLLRELGSFEAFVDYAAGGALAGFADSICETIGDHSRVVRAFAGVRIRPEEESRRWVGRPEGPLRYKRTESHWINSTASIYR